MMNVRIWKSIILYYQLLLKLTQKILNLTQKILKLNKKIHFIALHNRFQTIQFITSII